MIPELWYDPNCPVCSTLVKYADKNVEKGTLVIKHIESRAREPKYINKNSSMFVGTRAVKEFTKDFPSMMSVLSVLPTKWRVGISKAVYKTANAIRNKTSDCGCGK